jgi:hypothetical protein
MDSFIEQRAARAALISSGIVASVTAFMVKGLKQPLKVSLPLGVAAAVGLDYWNNVRETKSTLKDGTAEFRKIAIEILDSYEQDELENATTDAQIDEILDRYERERDKIGSDNVEKPTSEYVNEALTAGWLTLSWLGYMAVIGASELIWVRPAQQRAGAVGQVVARMGSAVVAAEASVWAPIITAYIRNDVVNLGSVISEATSQALSAANLAASVVDSVSSAVTNRVARFVGDQILARVFTQHGDGTDPFSGGARPPAAQNSPPASETLPDVPRSHMSVVDIEAGGETQRIVLNYGPRQASGAAPVVSVPLVTLEQSDVSDMVELLDLHPGLGTFGDGQIDQWEGRGAGRPGADPFGIDDIDLNKIWETFHYPETDSITTLGGGGYTASDQWDFLAIMDVLIPYWEREGFHVEFQPDSVDTGGTGDTDSDETDEFDLMYTILHSAGLLGMLTPDELYDILIQLLNDPTYQEYDPDKRFKKLPSMLRKLLGWGKTDPFLIPLARSIISLIGEELLMSTDAALGTVQASRGDASEDGSL